MTIIEDTRQQAKKHELKHKFFADNQIKVVRSKLPIGDYANIKNMSIIVDTKKDIQEIIGNVTGQTKVYKKDVKGRFIKDGKGKKIVDYTLNNHKRFIAECDLAAESDIKLIILIENTDNVTCINDLYKWYNIRLKWSPKATTGQTLAKILTGIEYRHNVKFEFCKPTESGKRIIELLGGDAGGKSTKGKRIHSYCK